MGKDILRPFDEFGHPINREPHQADQTETECQRNGKAKVGMLMFNARGNADRAVIAGKIGLKEIELLSLENGTAPYTQYWEVMNNWCGALNVPLEHYQKMLYGF